MKIAGLQMHTVLGDVPANLASIEKAALEAGSKGAKLLVTPELALSGYGAGSGLRSTAEPADGESAQMLSDIAKRAGIAIVAGFAENDGDRCFNSAFYTDGHGKTAVYRKTNLFADYERTWFEPSKPASVIVELDGIRLGFLICYDVEFPENVRRLALAGADLIVVPTALPAGPAANFVADHMIKVRAFENEVHIAYINNAGRSGDYQFAGRSQIASPFGATLVEANGSDHMLIYADVNPPAYATSPLANSYLHDLRQAQKTSS